MQLNSCPSVNRACFPRTTVQFPKCRAQVLKGEDKGLHVPSFTSVSGPGTLNASLKPKCDKCTKNFIS